MPEVKSTCGNLLVHSSLKTALGKRMGYVKRDMQCFERTQPPEELSSRAKSAKKSLVTDLSKKCNRVCLSFSSEDDKQ